MRSLYKVFLTSPLLPSPIFSQIVRLGTPSLPSPDNNTNRSTVISQQSPTGKGISSNIDIPAVAKSLWVFSRNIGSLHSIFAGLPSGNSHQSFTSDNHFGAAGKDFLDWSDGSVKQLFFTPDDVPLQVFSQICDRNSAVAHKNSTPIAPINLKIGTLDLTFITSLYFP